MLNLKEASKFEETLSRQKSLKSPGKCRKCKVLLDVIELHQIRQEDYLVKWDSQRNEYMFNPAVMVRPSYLLKEILVCKCGAKVPKRREKK
jgi:hypothetical protein